LVTRIRHAPVPFILVAVYAVLGVTWAVTNPPFSAPDESQHYLRAVGLGNGQWVGRPTVYDGPVLSRKETAWRHKLTRAVKVPSGLSPVGYECELFRPDVPASCIGRVQPNSHAVFEQTDVGIYQPEPYLLPAMAVRLASHPAGADRAGRLAMLLIWVILLSLAAWSAWDRRVGPISLLGLVLAITPQVVFMGSSLTDSSVEIIASIAFFALLLRLLRGDDEPVGGRLILAGAVGAVLALSRSLSPVWVICELLVCWVLVGNSGGRAVVRRAAVPAAIAAALLVIGIGLNVLWVAIYGPHVSPTLVPGFSALHDGISQLRFAWDGVFGSFGYEDVPLGRFGVVLWTLVALAAIVLAVRFATRRERGTLLLAIVLAIALPVYLYAAIFVQEGVQTQGRHILPLLVVVPLLTGELVRRHAAILPRLAARLTFPVAAVLATAIQLLAWWENSRRYAVGLHGTWWFLPAAKWSPPGGWSVWVVVLLTVACAIAIASLTSIAGAVRERSLRYLPGIRGGT
jgi:hypothetical protein